mmetsp:Transcript_20740/g.71590  ORF Transcript_20740/g.71590 Transcript_20740/m.71590 type:complete len:200 (+) Transcript_20740:788-1387(+)
MSCVARAAAAAAREWQDKLFCGLGDDGEGFGEGWGDAEASTGDAGDWYGSVAGERRRARDRAEAERVSARAAFAQAETDRKRGKEPRADVEAEAKRQRKRDKAWCKAGSDKFAWDQTHATKPPPPPPPTHFQTLGVLRGATAADVRKAYVKLALLYHPDRAAAHLAAGAVDMMARLNHARDVLCDPELRRRHEDDIDAR